MVRYFIKPNTDGKRTGFLMKPAAGIHGKDVKADIWVYGALVFPA